MSRTLIAGGLVVDGSGGPARAADVLLADGEVAAIGAVEADGAEVVDASGCVVAPGFVDVHTHADFTLLAFPDAASAVRQGVTTVVVGNCGGGVAPIVDAHDFRRVAFAYSPDWGVEVTWRSFEEYLGAFPRTAVNVVALVPHGGVRNAVMGLAEREPTAAELAEMRRLVDEALAAGAAGLSTGLEYQPGCYARPAEIEALAEVVAARGGFYSTHMRNRAEGYAAATAEAIDVGRRTGVRLQLSHVAPRPYAPREQVERALGLVQEARADGLALWVDTFPETWGPGTLVDLFPREVTQGAPDEVLRRLRDPAARRRIGEHFDSRQNFLVRAAGYEQIFVAAAPTRPEAVGRSLPELAAAAGATIADYCCDLLVESGRELLAVVIRHVYATEDDLRRVLALPCCSLGSDGVVTSGEDADCAYPWSASTYGYAARTLAHYARETALLSLEEAVRRLAALPAEAAGLAGRGVLREGAAADVVVFDADGLVDRTAPGIAARHPRGVRHVFVNGEPAVADGEPTGARPGLVLGKGGRS